MQSQVCHLKHRMAASARKFSAKSSWSRRIEQEIKKCPLGGSKATTRMQLRTLGMYKYDQIISKFMPDIWISKIFKSDMFVGFEVNDKVELDLKFVRMVTWDTHNFKSM